MGTGPSTKETTLHHFREPLIDLLSQDKEVDFLGIVVAGTSDEQEHKVFVARRVGALLESMRADGAIVSIDSWGNCHIDFANVIEAIGEKGIPLVGMSFVGKQAAFVVTNSYMDSIIDLNKTAVGDENCVMGQNTAVELDAIKAVKILKNKIHKKNPEKIWRAESEKQIRRLIMRSYEIKDVEEADRTAIMGNRIQLNTSDLVKKCTETIKKDCPQVKEVKLRVIRPHEHDVFINSVLDFSPIAAKAAGRPGDGITHTLTGVQVMLTAVEEGGFQPANIGSSEGILKERVAFGMHGAPSADDFIINVDVLLAEGEGRTREGIMAAHQACDTIIQELRQDLRGMNRSQAVQSQELWDTARPGACKIVLVKLVSGLGCLYDTSLFPNEPAGYIGSKSIMDRCNNVQIVISPNEYRDGVIRSLT
ncbi:hypothetical protein LJC48_04385 [Desulfovibrio sp. OttesenSCG-928-C06]|nr:hypothetical protein [Desulfovibrio sp. OttesenSCG-928-C06]